MGLVDDTGSRPLILTVQMDAQSHQFFDAQRTRYFPPAINYLAAHITLFHHLPGLEREQIAADLAEAASRQTPMHIQVTGLRNLGRGVAYTLESATLSEVRDALAERWLPWLTIQDRQRFKPHLTVQNKVVPEEARRTLRSLQEAFQPRSIEGTGLELWRYDHGPWHLLQAFPFA